MKDVSYEVDPNLPPTTTSSTTSEIYFGIYEQVLGFNTSIYHEPTEMELNFAISERANPISGNLIFDYNKGIRKMMSTTVMKCENSINEEDCKYD
jgi:hypothetical protein